MFRCKFILFSLIFLPLSIFAQDLTNLGGTLSSDFSGPAAIQVPLVSVLPEGSIRRKKMLDGFGFFHSAPSGVGPLFINSTCGGCHVSNGKGPAKFSRLGLGSAMVIKVSSGKAADGTPIDVPGVGAVISDHTVTGVSSVKIKLTWQYINGEYSDAKYNKSRKNSTYQLRKPVLDIKDIPGLSPSQIRKMIKSLRMSPAVIGPGLLEAVPESSIIAMADPADLNSDGISGFPNFVPDLRSGNRVLGRFGFKAVQPTVEQQSAAALFNEMGITNPLFTDSSNSREFSEESLELLNLYQKLGGVPKARNQTASNVIAGKELFQQLGCDSCHKMTLTTGNHVDPELSNQVIHPFTDLLLHDMGSGLADKRGEFSALGSEWKTTPLWGLGFAKQLSSSRALYLHDGRARSIEEAIIWHGGEAKRSKTKFMKLPKAKRSNLISFLKSL